MVLLISRYSENFESFTLWNKWCQWWTSFALISLVMLTSGILGSETEAEYLHLPYHTRVQWLSSGHISLWCFGFRLRLKFFSMRRIIFIHCFWTQMALEISFCGRLMFLNEFNLKLQGKTVLSCETYAAVKLFKDN